MSTRKTTITYSKFVSMFEDIVDSDSSKDRKNEKMYKLVKTFFFKDRKTITKNILEHFIEFMNEHKNVPDYKYFVEKMSDKVKGRKLGGNIIEKIGGNKGKLEIVYEEESSSSDSESSSSESSSSSSSSGESSSDSD